MENSEPTYKIDMFEGPLDLLLSLISKNKVSITDIPIVLICDQYMDYISQAKQMEMDVAAEFIVMASELLLIKSKMLLPKTGDDDEDPRAPLTDALLKYTKAKADAKLLLPRYEKYSGRMAKDTDEIKADRGYVEEQDAAILVRAMRRVISSNQAIENAVTTHFIPMIKKAPVPVELKLSSVMRLLERENSASLDSLLSECESRSELVATFIAVLELIKSQRVLIAVSADEACESGNISTEDTVLLYNSDYVEDDSAPDDYGDEEE